MDNELEELMELIADIGVNGMTGPDPESEVKFSRKRAEEMGIKYNYVNLLVEPGVWLLKSDVDFSFYKFKFSKEEQPYFYYQTNKIKEKPVEGLNPKHIVKAYYTNWLLNDYIVNKEYGNDFSKLMLELDKMGYEYVICAPEINELAESELAKDTLKMSKPTYPKNLGESWMTDKSYNDYIKSMGDLSQVDWYRYKKDMGYYPVIIIALAKGQLSDEEIKDLEEKMTKFYNDEEMYVKFNQFDFSENVFFMDSEEYGDSNKNTKNGDKPVYSFKG